MSEMMNFPETWEEYEKLYGFNDSEEIYTNNSRLIPSFRVKQWLDNEAKQENKQQATVLSDCIYRQQALEAIRNIKAITGTFDDEILLIDKAQAQTELMMLPSAEPERKKGEWVRNFDGNEWHWFCSNCKEEWYEEDLWMGGNNFPNFCPNCGADMGGDSKLP